MEIDEHIKMLESCELGFTGYVSNFQDTIDVAIDVMKRYQKIDKILDKSENGEMSMYDTLQEIERCMSKGIDYNEIINNNSLL